MEDDRAVRGRNWRVEGVKQGYLERYPDEKEDREAVKRQREKIEMDRLKMGRAGEVGA